MPLLDTDVVVWRSLRRLVVGLSCAASGVSFHVMTGHPLPAEENGEAELPAWQYQPVKSAALDRISAQSHVVQAQASWSGRLQQALCCLLTRAGISHAKQGWSKGWQRGG